MWNVVFQRLEKEAIGIEAWPAAPPLLGRWGNRQAIDESNQGDKERHIVYHWGCLRALPHVATTVVNP